jgi:hypothetical protein
MNEDKEEFCDQDSSPDIWMIKKSGKELDNQGMWHVWEKGEVLTGFW